MTALTARTVQSAALAQAEAQSGAITQQIVALVGVAPPVSYRAETSGVVTLAHTEADTLPRTSQMVVLAATRTSQPDLFTNRAWTFDMDGHQFYVLQLGPVGTFVYDTTTQSWSQWYAGELRLWNMHNGLGWNRLTVAGDMENPILYQLDPELSTDEGFRQITRVVTGASPVRGRQAITCDALYITASVGFPSLDGAQMSLRFSNDQGNTFSSYYSVTLDNSTSQQVAFRSLGLITAPGRIFEIKDTGGVVRIDGADLMLDGEAE